MAAARSGAGSRRTKGSRGTERGVQKVSASSAVNGFLWRNQTTSPERQRRKESGAGRRITRLFDFHEGRPDELHRRRNGKLRWWRDWSGVAISGRRGHAAEAVRAARLAVGTRDLSDGAERENRDFAMGRSKKRRLRRVPNLGSTVVGYREAARGSFFAAPSAKIP
jgi:hypothetical protein